MRNNLAIVKALLSKSVARGATVGEEESAVAKAVEMMGKYAIPHSAVASVWPKGWDFKGKRSLTPPRQDNVSFDDLLNAHFRPARKATQEEKDKVHAWARQQTQDRATPQGKPGTLGDYACDLLMRNYANVGPYPYEYIISRIKARYPDAKTTVSSLRWYENKMRHQGKPVPSKRPAK